VTTTNLTIDNVAAGDRLPELQHDVTATTVVLGALASRDDRPMHHDRDFAQKRNGVQDIFLNTPNQAAWFERYLTDWSGPKGRLGRITFRMTGPVFPGDTMVLSGAVTEAWVDDVGCAWAKLDIELTVSGVVKTRASASIALPVGPDDNPWGRKGDRWRP
jgi:acyl dehydratase